jgi:hypothetical protein
MMGPRAGAGFPVGLVVSGKDLFHAGRKALQGEPSPTDKVVQASNGSQPVAVIDRLGHRRHFADQSAGRQS